MRSTHCDTRNFILPGLWKTLYDKKKGVLGFRLPRKDLVEEPTNLELNPVTSLDLSEDAQVIVSLFGKERSPEMLIEMGAALADGNRLEVAHLTEVPEQTDLRDFAEEPMGLEVSGDELSPWPCSTRFPSLSIQLSVTIY